MGQVKARCPECGSEHYLRRGTLVTSQSDGRREKCVESGSWCECFCGCMFLSLADGVRKVRSGQATAPAAVPPDGRPVVATGAPPDDHRPRPAMPKARA